MPRRKYPRPVITPEERQALFELQGGKCAVCGRDDVELCTDHFYRTGRTRGMCCRTCNTALGMSSASPTLVRAALQYVTKPSAHF
jgi:Autographiviridae endonuclease VII